MAGSDRTGPRALVTPREPFGCARTADTTRFARRLALTFFFGWLVVLLAGADRPPPPGFLVIVLLDAIAAGAILYRAPDYLRWQAARRRHRLVAVLGDGMVLGLAFALLPFLLGQGEPTVVPTAADRLIWFTVLATLGILNAVLVYTCVAVHRRRAAWTHSEASTHGHANADRAWTTLEKGFSVEG